MTKMRKIRKATMKIFLTEIRFKFTDREVLLNVYEEIEEELNSESSKLVEISEEPQCFMWIPLPKMIGTDIQKVIEIVDNNVDILEN